jgi:hypothetical protein
MTQDPNGIPHPVDAAYVANVARKSNLMLEAKLLRQQGENSAATRRFAEAARIETELADYCDEHGFPGSSRIHRYSAVGCWAGAGNFYQALTDAEAMLEQSDLPEPLRRHVEKYMQTLQNRLRVWYDEEQVSETAEVCA